MHQHNLRPLFVIHFILLFFINGYAQNEGAVVERSKNKVFIEGQIYYVHQVKPKETIYSICQAYNISQKDLLLGNPEISTGLREGQLLKITEQPEIIEKSNIIKSDNFIYHIVEPGQTLYFISKKYNVPVTELMRINPELEISSLQTDQVIKVPKSLNPPVSQNEAFYKDSISYIEHEVAKGETLYSLSKTYNVTVYDIQEANEEVSKNGLKTNSIIRIPVKTKIVSHQVSPTTNILRVDTGSIVKQNNELLRSNCSAVIFDYKTKVFNVALLLPLMLESSEAEIAAIGGNENDEPETSTRATTKLYPFLEFYEGALMAVEQLKQLGANVNLYVYDSGSRGDKIQKILSNPVFYTMDLIIGPFYNDNLKIVADFAAKNSIYMVSPLSIDKNIAYSNPYYFQIIPSQSDELKQMGIYLSSQPSNNIIIMHKGDIKSRDITSNLINAIQQHVSFTNTFDKTTVKQVVVNDSTSSNLDLALVKGAKNSIIIPSDEEVYVSTALRRLNSLAKRYDISVYGLPAWTKFNTIETNYLHNLNLHYYTPFYVNYNDPNTMQFLATFKQIYGYVPYRITNKGFNYAFLGYDVLHFFIGAMKQYGPSFADCISYYSPDVLSGNLRFTKVNNSGGFLNRGISIIEYTRDFELNEIKVPSKGESIQQYPNQQTQPDSTNSYQHVFPIR